MISSSSQYVTTSIFALFGMLALPAAAAAQTANPFAAAEPAAPAAAAPQAPAAISSTLRRFDASAEELFLAGERDTRDLAFYVTAMESARTASLHLALETAVSVMPEASRLQVFVNGTKVGERELAAANVQRLDADLPVGLLQPGYNAVRLVVTQRHRVDCSIPGTYELWTRIDPVSSGIDFGLRSAPIDSLTDIAAFVGNGAERTNLNVVLPGDATPERIETAMSAVQAVAVLGNVTRPHVTFGSASGSGPGLDIVIGPDGEGRGRSGEGYVLSPDITLAPGGANGRDRLMLGDAATGSIDRTVAELVDAANASMPVGTPEGIAALARRGGLALDADEDVPLSELGLDSDEFTGRFYRSSVRFSLPADFYPADYDRAELTIDAAYAKGLSESAQLIVKANQRQVTSIALASAAGGLLRQQTLKIPLGMLKPGSNAISFEALVPKAEDAVCDPAAVASDDPRFVLRPTSTLSVPNVARIGHLPDIALMANGGAAGTDVGPRALTVLAPNGTAGALDAVATIVARIATSSGQVTPIEYETAMSPDLSGDILAAGTYSSLPAELLSATGLTNETQLRLGVSAPTDDEALIDVPEPRQASFGGTFGDQIDIGERLGELKDMAFAEVSTFLSSLSGLPGLRSLISPDEFVSLKDAPGRDEAQTVVAQAATPGDVVRSWTVVVGETPEALSEGVAVLTKTDGWNRLEGAAVVLDPSGELSTIASTTERLFETQPRSVSNLRLVFAGWLSRHFYEYLAVLLCLMVLLGVSTRMLVRRLGTNGK